MGCINEKSNDSDDDVNVPSDDDDDADVDVDADIPSDNHDHDVDVDVPSDAAAHDEIGRDGWIAIGKALAINRTLKTISAGLTFKNRDLIAFCVGLRKNQGLESLDLSCAKV